MRCIALWIGLLVLQAAIADVANAQGYTLRIESPSTKAPSVSVGGSAKVPSLDPATGRWSVPIESRPPSFVTSYLISATDNSVVAVQLSIPGRILTSNQLVYMVPSSIKAVDEPTVRALWNSNEIVRRPRDTRVQFRYLQDLVYINREYKRRYKDNPRFLDAATLRSSFLLFQVVANLAQNTWYVIDPETQGIIDYAREKLVLGQRLGKTCPWLDKRPCAGVSQLIASVQALNSVRFTRMYNQLIPPGSSLSLDACSAGLGEDLRTFLTFLHEANEGDSGQSISETRVVNDIAACETRVALCTEQLPEAAIAQLDATITLLEPYRALARQRMAEVERARRDLAAGKPAVCPR